MKAELLNCPFCGGIASVTDMARWGQNVECNDCGACSKDTKEGEATLYSWWNSRATTNLQSRADRAEALLRDCRDVIWECMRDYGVEDGGSILRRLDEFLAEREG